MCFIRCSAVITTPTSLLLPVRSVRCFSLNGCVNAPLLTSRSPRWRFRSRCIPILQNWRNLLLQAAKGLNVSACISQHTLLIPASLTIIVLIYTFKIFLFYFVLVMIFPLYLHLVLIYLVRRYILNTARGNRP